VGKDTIIENTGNKLCVSLTDIKGIGLQDDVTRSFEPSNHYGYPNHGSPNDHFEIYNLSGNLVLNQSNIDVARFKCTECLSKGAYIVHVYLGDSVKQLKIVVP
jgi:hypothetical protein